MSVLNRIVIFFIFLAGGMYGCSSNNGKMFDELSDVDGKQIGILHDSATDSMLLKTFPNASFIEYDKSLNLFVDLEANRCNAAVLNEQTAARVLSQNSDYACLGSFDSQATNTHWHVIIPKRLMSSLESENETAESWIQKIQQSIYRNMIADGAWKLIAGGLFTTVVIFFFGAIWAIILAAFLTYLAINHRWPWLYRPLSWFVFTIHDVPSVVLMMFFSYVVFASVPLHGIVVAIIALGVYTSGTLTKIFKIHIQQIGKEQFESGKLLGLSSTQIYKYIILPQAFKSMLPLVVGELKVLLRATSYAGYIAQKDLVKAVDVIRGQTYDAFVPLLIVSLLYLLLSWLIARSCSWLYQKYFIYD